MMRRVMALLVFCLMVGSALVGQGRPAESAAEPELGVHAQAGREVIVQIGGRHCEYHRQDVDRALRRFASVKQVEFLNQHGTVLVRYQSGAERPEQLAEAVERALAMGWGCKAWVDRGG
ncbi:MAG: cation transporter [Nitrospirae bacterium]|nr:cation transporter [Nitrospirota bacterium]